MNSVLKHLVLVATLMPVNAVFCSEEDVLPVATIGWHEAREAYIQTAMEIVTGRDDVRHDPSERDFGRSRTELFRTGANRSLGFVHLDNEDGSEMQNVYVQNPLYGFALARSQDSQPWTLMSIVSRDSGVLDWVDEAGVAPWSILNIPLVEIVADPSFKLISITDEVVSNDACKVVTFELNSSLEGLIGELRRCELRICPDRIYVVDRFEAEFEGAGGGFRGVGKCSYEGTVLGVPRLHSYEYQLIRSAKKPITWKSDITRLEKCTKPKSEFTLSAFGLAEPKQEKNGSPLVWIALSALALLSAGVLLRRFAT